MSSRKKLQKSSQKKKSPLHEFEQVFELMKKHDILEFEWENKGEKFRAKVIPPHSGVLVDSISYSERHVPAQVVSTVSEAPPPLASSHKQVLSPFVGTFYRSPSPEAPPYVREGQTVKRGDVLCIIEAMKLMNEIEAEIPGRIVSVLVENGQPVEFGEPLYVVDVSG